MEKWTKERKAVKGAVGHNDKFKDNKYQDAKDELHNLTQDNFQLKVKLEELIKLHELNAKAQYEVGLDDDDFDNLPGVCAKPKLFGMKSDLEDSDIKQYIPVPGKKPSLFGDKSDPFGEDTSLKQYTPVQSKKPSLFNGINDPFKDGNFEPEPMPLAKPKPSLFNDKHDPFRDGNFEPEPIPLAKPKLS